MPPAPLVVPVLAAALAVLAAAPAPTLAAAPPAGSTPGAARSDRVLRDPRIGESSGLAVSARHPGVLWTLNDGDDGRLFAVRPNGQTAAAYRLGVPARDWEALAPGRDEQGRPVLWVGDIGDNASARTGGILVHRVPEPERLEGGQLRPTSYRLRYPDGPHDAEALLVDPRSDRLYVVTKQVFSGVVYAAPRRLDPRAPNVLERVGSAPGVVTDGSFLPDGRVAVRDYGVAFVAGKVTALDEAGRVPLPEQRQGESLAVLPEPSPPTLLVGSEGPGSRVWRVPLPPGLPSAPSSSTGGDDGGDDEERGTPRPGRRALAVLLVAGAALLGVGAARSRVRRWARPVTRRPGGPTGGRGRRG